MSYNTYVTSVGNGTNKLFNVPTPYLDRSHIHVFIDGVEYPQASFTFVTSGQVQLATAPVLNAAVVVRRITAAGVVNTAFQPGPIGSDDLNAAFQQMLYVCQEVSDIGTSYAQGVVDQVLDAVQVALDASQDAKTTAQAAAQAALDAAAAAAVATSFDPSLYYLKTAIDSLLATRDSQIAAKVATASLRADGTANAPVAYDATGALNATGMVRLRGPSAQQQRLEWWYWNGTAYVIDWILYRDTDGSLALYQQANGTTWRADHTTNKVNFTTTPMVNGAYNVALTDTVDRLLAYDGSRLTGLAVLQTKTVSYSAATALAVAIPLDNTKPQITEGTQILATTITPKSASSRLRITLSGTVQLVGAAGVAVYSLFVNGGADAVQTCVVYQPNSASAAVSFIWEYSPGSVAPQTLAVRCGPGGAYTITPNTGSSSFTFGGTLSTTMTVEELG